MNHYSPEEITAIATVATVIIATVAALIAALQYWRSRSLAELEANHRLRMELNQLVKDQLAADPTDEKAIETIATDFLEICEVYAASLQKGWLPSLSREFIQDFLRYDLLPLIEIEPYQRLTRFDPKRPNQLKYVRHFAKIHGHD